MYIINHQQKYLRVARLNDGYVDRFYIDDFFGFDRFTPQLDDIYTARVVKSRHGMVFVDVGDTHIAMLRTKKRYNEGQHVLVQVSRERMLDVGEIYKLGSKGCQVSDTLCILSTNAIAHFRQGHNAVTVKPRDERLDIPLASDNDLHALKVQALAILAKAKKDIATISLGPTPLERLMRDMPETFVFDHADTYLKAKTLKEKNAWPCHLELRSEEKIFEPCEDVWAELFLNTIVLREGGNVTIAPSPIGWIVDINGEGAKPSVVNLNAVKEIVRQIRLRNFSGNIIVDFAPTRERHELVENLKALLPPAFSVLGWSPGGLCELRAPKYRPSNPEIIQNLTNAFH